MTGLHVALGAKEIVHGVDLTIGDGECVGLICPSGSGKSMIAKSLLGLLPREARLSGGITMGDVAILTSNGYARGMRDVAVRDGSVREVRDTRGVTSVYAEIGRAHV